jgi:tyrosinase
LSPFWKTSTKFWISAELQNTVNLGYSYPEFDGLNLGNPQAVRIAIAQKVNALYGAVLPIPVPGAPAPAPPSGSCPNHGAWDWAARVHIKKYEVGTSFVVVFFLGEVPKEPKEWTTSNACVGRHYVMVNSNPQNCANCKTNSNVTVEGFVHLNDGLNQHLGSLAPEKVPQYLKDKLQWRVQKVCSFGLSVFFVLDYNPHPLDRWYSCYCRVP